MNQQLQTILAWVTVAMPIALSFAHGCRWAAEQLYTHALSTPSKADDAKMLRVLNAARALERVSATIGHLASLGVLRDPSKGGGS